MNRGIWNPQNLPRIYLIGWIALVPLILVAGVITCLSFDRTLADFIEGLWLGVLNLGILWTAAFLLIAIMGLLIRPRATAGVARTYWQQFRRLFAWGCTALVCCGFVAEFLWHSFDIGGGLLLTVLIGFLPMIFVVALLAFVRSRPPQ